MAEKSRVEMLEEFVQKKPNDAFTRYGLAMELKKLGRHEDAIRQFQTLTEKNEDYAPTYLMFGQLLTSLGRTDEARKVLEKGQTVAQRIGNMHAHGEISDALAGLG
jgi:tetratricopeptide (TPR) repeat protein